MDNKMSKKQKLKIEITPENGVDANKLRDKIHNFIVSIRKGCKSVRSWVVENKDDKKK